ncbi:MAG: hypothetical protein PHF67_05110 [Candidatus Nanoarchaeia archaeon]|nr:hypothetical protein [Candidatus Nanoarchaeia archaeon]
METEIPLKEPEKKRREYDSSLRFKYLDAVEWATNQMINQLRTYVSVNEIGPQVIVVKSEGYQPALCIQGLNREIRRIGLTSRVELSNNGHLGDLNFNLDELADEFFLPKGDEFLR